MTPRRRGRYGIGPLSALPRESGDPEATNTRIRKLLLIGVGIGLRPTPPSEPDGRFSRIRLSSRWFLIETVSRFARPCEVRTAWHSRSKHWAIVDDRRDNCRRPDDPLACAASRATVAGSSDRA